MRFAMCGVNVFIAFVPPILDAVMPGAALATGHRIWTSTSEPAAEHSPTTLASAGEKEMKFKSCFSAKKGT